jgi:uncharacterized protein
MPFKVERETYMPLIKSLFFTLIFAYCVAVARAQEPAVTASPAPSPTASPAPEVSAAKRALIKEILEITNSRETAEGMFTAQFDELNRQMPDVVWQSLSSMDAYKKLAPAQQEELRTRLKERSDRFAQRLKELFLARVDMKQLTEEISYVVYDKHFTEVELKDLVAFYGSATGKKVIREMPALMAESMAKAGDFIGPKVRDIIEDIKKTETAELAQEIEKLLLTEPKTPAKKRTTRRRH